jgi:hypothetical protein
MSSRKSESGGSAVQDLVNYGGREAKSVLVPIFNISQRESMSLDNLDER